MMVEVQKSAGTGAGALVIAGAAGVPHTYSLQACADLTWALTPLAGLLAFQTHLEPLEQPHLLQLTCLGRGGFRKPLQPPAAGCSGDLAKANGRNFQGMKLTNASR